MAVVHAARVAARLLTHDEAELSAESTSGAVLRGRRAGPTAASVLALVDMTYCGRFRTCSELYLSLLKITAAGLASAPVDQRRLIVRCIHNAKQETMENMVIEMWAGKSPAEALEVLVKPDVVVTNQSDKDMQLTKLKLLNEFAIRAFSEYGGAPVVHSPAIS